VLALTMFLGATLLPEPFGQVAWIVASLSVGLLPIAIGIAVLRYRLYEIDRIISRTIGWAIVSGLLVGAFVLLVLGLTAVLEPLTGGNTLAIAGSTLVVAALFTPVRSRVQRLVDRRFDRSRYDGQRLLAVFGERLRDEVDLPTIRSEVLATVDAAVRPSGAGLWLRRPDAEGGA
jgi:divalent metal cation (Fe/Co/Zn/Cd) transporter